MQTRKIIQKAMVRAMAFSLEIERETKGRYIVAVEYAPYSSNAINMAARRSMREWPWYRHTGINKAVKIEHLGDLAVLESEMAAIRVEIKIHAEQMKRIGM